MITVPPGLIGMSPFEVMNDPTHGNRTQRFTYHLEDNEGAPLGALSGVVGGSLEWHANAQIKGGGKITLYRESNDIPWLSRRVKIVHRIEGLGDFPLGVFIPSVPAEKWDDSGVMLEVELLDKTSALAQDFVETTYTLNAGTVVTTAVRTLITSTGEAAGSITDSTETLSHAMTWEAGTSKLTIINAILEAAGFFALRVDGNGSFVVEKSRLPSDRPTVYEFIDGANSIYRSSFDYEKDIYSVPNKVILVAQGSGTEEGLVAVATNQNPNSPYSYQSRGRWIVDMTRGVEATDQAALNARANRRLAQLTSPTGSVTIDHAPLPWLDVSDVVRFRRSKADIDIRAVVSSTQITLDPTALQRTQLQEVAEL